MASRDYVLIDDLPLDEARRFNFDRIVDTLFGFVTNSQNRTPLSLCIDGTWGSGKTSLMRTLRRRLEEHTEHPHVEPKHGRIHVPLWFEPWKLSDEAEVLGSLVELVLRKIQDDAGLVSSAQIEVDRKDALRVLAQRFLQVSPDDLSAYYQWSSRVKGTFTEVERLFHKIAESYLNSGETPRCFVVFVDDLDRCPPLRVTAVLEAVKLFFSMPGFIFVFGMDKNQVVQAIRESYASFDDEDSQVYLEKMFQLTYSLPTKESESLVSFVSEAMEGMGLLVRSRSLLRALVDTFGRNLRNLKLFLNRFNVERHLIGAEGTSIDDEVLFKWLYVSSVLPQSIEVAMRGRSLGLLVALEFLAQGAVLDDPERYNTYRASLMLERIQYLPLLAWALLPGEDEEQLDDGRLTPEQLRVVSAIRRDGRLLDTLRVLREGETFFVDQDLGQLAYLTRRETLDREVGPETRPPAGNVLSEFEADFILSKHSWSALGDRFYYHKKDYLAAYLAYLLTILLDFQKPVYWSDLGAAYRRFGLREAALAMFRRGYDQDPSSIAVNTQLAYLYDIEDDDDQLASLFYRKAIALGGRQAVPRYNLALNLKNLGETERAYACALDAYALAPDDESKRKRAIEYAELIGKVGLDFESRDDGLAVELDSIRAEGLIPYPLTPDEEVVVASLIAGYPSLCAVRDQIRALPA